MTESFDLDAGGTLSAKERRELASRLNVIFSQMSYVRELMLERGLLDDTQRMTIFNIEQIRENLKKRMGESDFVIGQYEQSERDLQGAIKEIERLNALSYAQNYQCGGVTSCECPSYNDLIENVAQLESEIKATCNDDAHLQLTQCNVNLMAKIIELEGSYQDAIAEIERLNARIAELKQMSFFCTLCATIFATYKFYDEHEHCDHVVDSECEGCR